MKTISKKLLSLLLTVAIVLQLLPVAVFAEETELPAAEPLNTTQDVPSSATVLFEEESLREEDVKHFRLDDGTFVAIRYGTPVHYEDDGEWVEYDNTLLPITAQGTDSVTGYRVVNGDSVRLFAADANAEVLLAVQKGNYGLSMTPIREPDAELPIAPDQPVVANGSITEDSEATLIPAEILTTAAPAAQAIEDPLLAQVQPEKLYSSLEYPASFHGATLRYENYGNTMKESIVISAPQTEYSYAFALQTEGLTPTLQTDGSILLAAADGTVVYAIPAPYMVDANQEYSYDATYTLTGSGSSYILTVTADADWINAEGRAFPVLLDPTITEFATSDTMISATYVRQGNSSNTVANNPDPDRTGLYAGALDITSSNPNGLTRSYFHINEGFIDLPAGCELIHASFFLYHLAYSKKAGGSNTLDLGIYALDKANGLTLNTISPSAWATWAQNLTWNDAENTAKTLRRTTLVDKQSLSVGTRETYIAWDITSMAFDWYQDPQTNLGFVLMATDESTVSSHAAFPSPSNPIDPKPAMAIIYRNTVGVETYYTYQTVGIGRAGTAYIGDFSMQNTLVTPVISSQSNVMPFSLSLIYNSAYGTKHFTAEAADIHTKDFSKMNLGAGWKLSLQETVVPITVDDTNYLVYTDADGTEHYFQYDSEAGKYKDEDGLDLTISVSGSSYTMNDLEGNSKYFETGYLKRITDAYENEITYIYNSDHQITSVTRKNSGSDVTETLATLTYSNNHLTSITDEANRVTGLSYTTVQGITCLREITFPDGQKAQYTYKDSANFYEQARLEAAYDAESNYGIEFSYSYSRDIRNIYEYVLSGTTRVYGTKMHGYKRSRSQAVYRHYGDDQDENTKDDLLSFKIFDYEGRTITAYTTDRFEARILGVGSAAYTQNSGTSPKNNRLTAGASSGQQGVDLMTNNSGELGAVHWTGGSSETTNVLYGTKAFAVTDSALYRNVALSAGVKYTFSAYVKVPDGSSAYLSVTGDTSPYNSLTVDYPTAGANDGWQRISCTFTPASTKSYQIKLIATGTVYADALQLEEGDAPSTYNLLEEGSFENATASNLTATTSTAISSANAATWYRSGTFSVNYNEDHPFGNKAISLPGDAANHRVLQRVGMACEPGTVFLVSAWAKAAANPHSVAKKTSIDSDEPFFGIIVRLCYSDGTTDDQYFSFDPLYDGWQHLQSVVASKQEHAGKALSDVIVLLAYDRNYNTALFDNASLRIEPGQTYYYDEKGNLISSAQAGAGSDSADYAENGVDLLEYTAANGNKFNYTYNTQHDVLTATASGIKNTYVYDAAGNVFSSTLTSTNTTENPAYLYTVANASPDKNHTTMVNDSSGGITSYTYNYGYQYMTSSTNADGVTTYYTYYPQNSRPKQTYQSNIAAVTYTYDGGQLSQLDRKTFRGSSPEGLHQYYNFTYNIWGQNTSVKVGTIPLATYAYEDFGSNAAGTGGGLMSQMTYGNGDPVMYSYDMFDRLVEVLYNDTGNYVSYVYNADSALAELHYKTSADSIIVSYYFEYDSLGRLVRSSEYDADGLVQRTEHLYDEYSRLDLQHWSIGGKSWSEEYSYDDGENGDGSLTQFKSGSDHIINFNYDPLRRLDKASVTNSSGAELFKTAYDYEAVSGNRSSTRVQLRNVYTAEDVLITGYEYLYDVLGNITAIYESELKGTNTERRQIASYEYDSQNQLTHATIYAYALYSTDMAPKTTSVFDYTYDTAGNILSETKSVTEDGSTTTTTKTYTYSTGDWKDLLTSVTVNTGTEQTLSYDGSGNPTAYYNGEKSYTNLTWQQGRNLASVTVDGTTTTYAYDMNGIRTQKTVDGVVHTYITQNGRLVRESFPYGDATIIMDFIYDESGRPFALDYSKNGGSSYNTYFYATNAQGDVEGLFQIVLNTTNNKYEQLWYGKYIYDAWGKVTATTTAGGTPSATSVIVRNPIRYRGYVYDNETGWYYLQSRYYDPANHRFINADSLASTGQGFVGTNMFAYCNNSPVCFSDPSGKMAGTGCGVKSHSLKWECAPLGGGGGAVVVGTIATVAILIDWDAVGDFFVSIGESLYDSFVFDSALEEEDSDTEYLVAIEEAKKKDRIYYGTIIKRGRLCFVTTAMTFDEAYYWALGAFGTLGIKETDPWGIYTNEKSDAMAMAFALGNYAEPIGTDYIKSGHYNHYHVKGRKFLELYDHFHIWYGAPVT